MAENKPLIAFRVDPEIKEALEALAARDPELSVSAIIRRAVRRELGIYDSLSVSEEAVTAAVDQRLMELGLAREMKAVAVAQDKLLEGVQSGQIYYDNERKMLRRKE